MVGVASTWNRLVVSLPEYPASIVAMYTGPALIPIPISWFFGSSYTYTGPLGVRSSSSVSSCALSVLSVGCFISPSSLLFISFLLMSVLMFSLFIAIRALFNSTSLCLISSPSIAKLSNTGRAFLQIPHASVLNMMSHVDGVDDDDGNVVRVSKFSSVSVTTCWVRSRGMLLSVAVYIAVVVASSVAVEQSVVVDGSREHVGSSCSSSASSTSSGFMIVVVAVVVVVVAVVVVAVGCPTAV
mmetsp:Transcript_29565/g.61681  ORF Transcript_29565/g.61681 Transcript_29565/m.61681 type:complete len:241 (+) Transcript_29565:733-1455(+)